MPPVNHDCNADDPVPPPWSPPAMPFKEAKEKVQAALDAITDTATLESTEPIWVLVTLDDGDELVGTPVPQDAKSLDVYAPIAADLRDKIEYEPPAVVRWAAGRGRDFAAIDALSPADTTRITLIRWRDIRRIEVLPDRAAALAHVLRIVSKVGKESSAS